MHCIKDFKKPLLQSIIVNDDDKLFCFNNKEVYNWMQDAIQTGFTSE